jgi:hypothetical protein
MTNSASPMSDQSLLDAFVAAHYVAIAGVLDSS